MNKSLVDNIQQSNDIVDVIGSYIKLHRAGKSFKAICPFHNDTHPSMQISPQKQIFKCFACGKGGNVITFVKDYEKISFFEALKLLGNRVGINVDDKPKSKSPSTIRREQLLQTYESAKNHFLENLEQFGGEVITYLDERGLSEETRNKFELGYALDSYKGLKNYLLKKSEIPTNILKISGLFKQGNTNSYDMFRNRLIFPIHSHLGKVVAFGGRKLDETEKGGKYINSPTTEIYEKGKDVYGLFKTKYEISKMDYSLITEGYMDFLRLYESGFINAVAGLGTALTMEQVKLIGRYSENFILLYDGDIAGQQAAMKAGFNIIKSGYSAKVIQLPNDEDPDSFILNNGAEALENKIINAISYTEFIKNSKDLGKNQKEKIDYLQELIAVISDRLNKELFMKKISETFNISESIFYPYLTQKKKRVKVNSELTKNPEERIVIHYLIHHPNDYEIYKEKISEDIFQSPLYKSLYKKILDSDFFTTKSLQNEASLLNYFEDDKNLVDLMSEFFFNKIDNINIGETIVALKIRNIQKQIRDIDNEIVNNSEDEDLLKTKAELKNRYNTLSRKVVKKTLR